MRRGSRFLTVCACATPDVALRRLRVSQSQPGKNQILHPARFLSVVSLGHAGEGSGTPPTVFSISWRLRSCPQGTRLLRCPSYLVPAGRWRFRYCGLRPCATIGRCRCRCCLACASVSFRKRAALSGCASRRWLRAGPGCDPVFCRLFFRAQPNRRSASNRRFPQDERCGKLGRQDGGRIAPPLLTLIRSMV